MVTYAQCILIVAVSPMDRSGNMVGKHFESVPWFRSLCASWRFPEMHPWGCRDRSIVGFCLPRCRSTAVSGPAYGERLPQAQGPKPTAKHDSSKLAAPPWRKKICTACLLATFAHLSRLQEPLQGWSDSAQVWQHLDPAQLGSCGRKR